MPEDDFSGPLLITGSSRSGTTYLRRVVMSLPGVCPAFESDLLKDAYQIFRKEDVLASREAFEQYLNRLKRIDLVGEPAPGAGRNNPIFQQTPDFYNGIYEDFRKHRDFGAFIADMYRAGRKECEIWGDKCEVDQVLTFFDLFPQSRVIFIVRDPRAVISSFSEHSGVNYCSTSLSWVHTTRLANQLLEERGDQQVLVLRYERLILEIEAVLRQIASFLGREVPSDVSLIEQPQTVSLGKWRERLSKRQVRQVEEICFDEMCSLGYEPEQAKGKRKVGALTYGIALAQHAIALLRNRRIRFSHLLEFRRIAKYLGYHKKL